MKKHAPRIGLFAAVLALAALGVYAYLALQADHTRDSRAGTISATSTEEVATTTEPTVTETVKEIPKPAIIPTPQSQPAPTYAPPVIINTNIQNNPAPQQFTPPPATSAPAPEFIEPRELSDLEIAKEIADLYGWYTASIKYVGENQDKINVAYKGKSVTVDLVGDWQENLKLWINKIK